MKSFIITSSSHEPCEGDRLFSLHERHMRAVNAFYSRSIVVRVVFHAHFDRPFFRKVYSFLQQAWQDKSETRYDAKVFQIPISSSFRTIKRLSWKVYGLEIFTSQWSPYKFVTK